MATDGSAPDQIETYQPKKSLGKFRRPSPPPAGNQAPPATKESLPTEIDEVRDVQAGQEIKPALIDIKPDKLAELRGAVEHEKKIADMQMLTAIDKKVKSNQEITPDELSFLYEIDAKIEGFGHDKDPRIEELKAGRDWKKDMQSIFEPSDDQDLVAILINQDQIGAVVTHLEEFQNLNVDIAIRLIRARQVDVVIDHLDIFPGPNSNAIATELIDAGLGKTVITNLDKFPGLHHQDVADRLISARLGRDVVANLDKFRGLNPEDTAIRLIYEDQGDVVAEHLAKFNDPDGVIRQELTKRGIKF